jgi:SAM-dependent methyltransferase
MLNDPENVLKYINQDDRVLDVGGAAEVFPRANAVIDILPYESRSQGKSQKREELFTEEDWYVGDICLENAWDVFDDDEFDFVICSHVLEDVRDPILVCSQMIRVGKAGYIETPSRFRECAKQSPNDLVSGWEHHRWIVDVDGGRFFFTPKLAWANQFDYLGDANRRHLHDFTTQFLSIHWIGSFDYAERVHKGAPLETENLFYFYKHYPYNNPQWEYTIVNEPESRRTLLWRDEYTLPIELVTNVEEVVANYQKRLRNSFNSP